jgi:hypothetical protein
LTEQTQLLIGDKGSRIQNKQIKNIQELRKDFIRFTNVYWFHDVTAQTQGQEIFKLQQQALELQREYEFIKEEMVRLDEYLQGDFNNDLNFFLKFFTIFSVFLAFTQIFISTDDLIKIKTALGLDAPEVVSKLVHFTQGVTVFVSIIMGGIAFYLLIKEIKLLIKEIKEIIKKR